MADYREFHCPHGDDFEGGDECDRCGQYELCIETPPANVIELDEYEKLKKEYAELRSKIDKAIAEIEVLKKCEMRRFSEDVMYHKALKKCLEILKRNIGE